MQYAATNQLSLLRFPFAIGRLLYRRMPEAGANRPQPRGAQQACNFEAEKRCAEFRLQAGLKGGLILKQMQKTTGAKGIGKTVRSSDTTTLADLGITKDQSSHWPQLAENPKAVEPRRTGEIKHTPDAVHSVAR
jgi:hypothetical protein